MRVAVLGGAGFAGGHLSTYLADRGHDILAVDSLVRPGSEFNVPRLFASGVRVHRGDVRCQEDWGVVWEFLPEAVIDCAAQPSAVAGYRNPRLDFTANTFAILSALELCRETGAAFVLFSTNKVYPAASVAAVTGPLERLEHRLEPGRPVEAISELCPLDGGGRSLYGASKVAADLMVQEWADAYGFPVICNRFSCLAGPWQWGQAEQGWVAWWVIAHRLGLPLQYIGHEGRQVRDVLAADDLCRLIELQLEDPRPGPEAYNVGGGPIHTLSLRECTAICQDVTGRTVPVQEVQEPRKADFPWYVSDITSVCARYGWAPSEASDPESLIESIDAWVVDHLPIIRTLFPDALPEVGGEMEPVDPTFAAGKVRRGYRSAVFG